MLQRNVWKIVFSLVVIGTALWMLFPIKDREFPEYAQSKATAKQGEFAGLLKEATERTKQAGQTKSVYIALRSLANERRIDLATQYFPHLDMGATRNLEKRNAILLEYLLKHSKGKLQLGLDLRGGVGVMLEAGVAKGKTEGEEYERKQKLEKAIEIIGTRINGFGVTEPVIRAVGDNRIEIQLPGVNTKDNPEVIESIQKPARLEFRLVHEGTGPMREPPTQVPVGYEVLTVDEEDKKTGEIYPEYYLVKRRAEMTGANVDDAWATAGEIAGFRIMLAFNSAGGKQFGDLTSANVGRKLAIVLDGKLYSAPNINEPIMGGQASITGNFSQEEAISLANVLDNPLDVPLEVKEQYEVGPTLADDAVASGRLAFLIGTSLTILFVLFFYTIGGIVAAIGMGVNVVVTLGVMAAIPATLTLPGIAGIVLTLAMSVDSNILIFERMREELKLGKTLPTALEAGFDKAWSAILDSNLTTLIVAVIMIALGTGPVRGFGVTLAIGIFTTMFAAVVVSKLIMELAILPGLVKRMPMFSVLQDTKFDFLKYAKHAVVVSVICLVVGVAALVIKKDSIYGIDFVGGDTITMGFSKRIEPAALTQAAGAAGFKEATFGYQKSITTGDERLLATTRFGEGRALLDKLQQAFPQAELTYQGENRIGPSVGQEIQWNALWSIFWALVLILLYVAFRFEFGFGIGAVVATVHDLIMTIGIFVLFDRQFDASMVAAILLIAGYSINDTIVVFDRIREELRLNPTMRLRDVINRALNLTLSRTVITGGTTMLTAITLIVVTKGEVNNIAFTLLIGVVTGTFSSLFVASPVFYWWHKGDRKHVEKHQDVKPTYEWTGASKASE